jgi:DNA gyrase/topoisomerase IV subunit A
MIPNCGSPFLCAYETQLFTTSESAIGCKKLMSMANHTTEFTIQNVSIVKDDNGKYGIMDTSGNLVKACKYNSISNFTNDSAKRYLKLEEDGKFGVYDALKVDDVCCCTLSEIQLQGKIIKGKEPILGKFSWNVELDLNEYEK